MEYISFVCNGEIRNYEWFGNQIRSAVKIVAVDGGANHLQKVNRLPDLFVGDRDSVGYNVQEWLDSNSVVQEILPVDKDKSDLEVALKIVGSDLPIKILAGFGGRVDHFLTNLSLLFNTEFSEYDLTFLSYDQIVFAAKEIVELNSADGVAVSLIPLSGEVEIVSSKGLKWPLINDVLYFGSSRGLSNIIISENAQVIVKSGELLIVQSRN